MEFSGQDNPIFRGSKAGRIYLTSHRMIFNSKKSGDEMQSFSAPFIAMNDVSEILSRHFVVLVFKLDLINVAFLKQHSLS